MKNYRLMTSKEYDLELGNEARELATTIPQMEKELRADPQGCFGGRGDNFGFQMIAEKNARWNHLRNLGYIASAENFGKLVEAGVEAAPISRIRFFAENRKGQKNVLRIEVDGGGTYRSIGGEWTQEPPTAIVEHAERIVRALGAEGLGDWHGDFVTPTVYL